MSAHSADHTPGADDESREALIAHCHLSIEAVERISKSMAETGMSFIAAALDADLVTPNEVAESAAKAYERSLDRDRGIIETAMRRQGNTSRSLALRHSSIVRPSKELILAYDAQNPHSERVRALRTELLMLHEPGYQANMIAVASPCHGEGRSLLAADLAIAFAQLGRRTLLVDLDMRAPRQHQLFGTENTGGFVQAVAMGSKLAPLGVEGLPSLSLMLSGGYAHNALELLASDRVPRLMSDWRNNYEFIVFDTPPISKFADGVAIAAIVGRILLVSHRNTTPHRQVKDLLRRLANAHARIVGAVINTF